MSIERRYARSMFDPGELVELRQMCMTAGKVFPPGKYVCGELPEVAFELGLVDRLPPIKGKSKKIEAESE